LVGCNYRRSWATRKKDAKRVVHIKPGKWNSHSTSIWLIRNLEPTGGVSKRQIETGLSIAMYQYLIWIDWVCAASSYYTRAEEKYNVVCTYKWCVSLRMNMASGGRW
jgi:hypothetical protein